MMDIFLKAVRNITEEDLKQNNDVNVLLSHTIEELGEFAKALTVEQGYKKKELNETSQQEAVDVVICALALFYARGGNDEMLFEYGLKKLEKWKKRLEVS